MKTEEQIKNEMLREAVAKGELKRVKGLIKIGADVHQEWKNASWNMAEDFSCRF